MNPKAARRHRRHYAILGVLAEHGPQTATGLSDLLHRAPGTIYPDLVVLELDARVIAEWTDTGFGLPRRRQYRLPTGTERGAA